MSDYPEDPRLAEARALSISSVWDRLGAPTKLTGGIDRAGPCPRCGGKDRFSINTSKNVWICRGNNGGCGVGGDVIALVQHVMGSEFLEALEYLAGERDLKISREEAERRVRLARESKERSEREAEGYRRAAIDDAKRIWSKSDSASGSLVADYLKARGIDWPHMPDCIRFIPDHPYVKGGGYSARTCHVGPCMIASIVTPQLGLTAVHQTWIDLDQPKAKAVISHPDTGEALKAKLVRGKMYSGAIRLASSARLLAGDGGVMVVGEGIETTMTALASRAAPGASCWCAVSMGHMSGRLQRGKGLKYKGLPILEDENCFRAPRGLSHLIYIQDGDSDERSTRSALQAGLRRAEYRQPGLKISIVHAGEGKDLNDLVMGSADG